MSSTSELSELQAEIVGNRRGLARPSAVQMATLLLALMLVGGLWGLLNVQA